MDRPRVDCNRLEDRRLLCCMTVCTPRFACIVPPTRMSSALSKNLPMWPLCCLPFTVPRVQSVRACPFAKPIRVLLRHFVPFPRQTRSRLEHAAATTFVGAALKPVHRPHPWQLSMAQAHKLSQTTPGMKFTVPACAAMAIWRSRSALSTFFLERRHVLGILVCILAI